VLARSDNGHRRLWTRWLLRLVALFAAAIGLAVAVPMLIPLPPVGEDPAVFAEPDGRFIDVNGLRTYYREQGDPNAPVVLLMHGFGGSTFSWRDTLAPLAEAGFRAIAFDRPPYGLSAKTGDGLPYTQSAAADFTAAFMDALGIGQAAVVGHSQGGGVLAHLLARHPGRVNAAVFVAGAVSLEGAAPEGDQGGPAPQFVSDLLGFEPVARGARLLVRAFVRPDAFAGLQRSAYCDPTQVTDAVAAGYAEQLQVLGWDEALIAILRGASFGDAPLTREQVAAFGVPILIVWGAEDTWVPLSAGTALADALTGETVLTYAQVGHLPMEEAPDVFNRDLIAFLLRARQPA
jgi:pimeloyl-ACP methyl ester carboxylesterase